MRGLKTLIKLQKTRVDEQRQVLAKLQAHLERVQKDIANFEALKERERVIFRKHPELGMTYGEFVKRAILKTQELEKSRQAADSAVEIARDRLALLFEEQKRYEIAEENRRIEAQREEGRLERINFDEIGSVSYTRKMKDK